MKKLIFWLLVIAETVLLFRISRILIFDIHRLTNYGYGYLTGLSILFIVIGFSLFLLQKRIHRRKQDT